MGQAPDATFSFCTRCGCPVEPYHGRRWHGDFEGDYDIPVATADRGRLRATDYWCGRCGAAWRALDTMETGLDRPCGHFMPANVRFCGACGRAE